MTPYEFEQFAQQQMSEYHGVSLKKKAPVEQQCRLAILTARYCRRVNVFIQIKDDFIQYAMRTAPKIIRATPGFRPKHSERRGNVMLGIPIRDEPSPLIHKLLLWDAPSPFTFLSLPQTPPEREAQPT